MMRTLLFLLSLWISLSCAADDVPLLANVAEEATAIQAGVPWQCRDVNPEDANVGWIQIPANTLFVEIEGRQITSITLSRIVGTKRHVYVPTKKEGAKWTIPVRNTAPIRACLYALPVNVKTITIRTEPTKGD